MEIRGGGVGSAGTEVLGWTDGVREAKGREEVTDWMFGGRGVE